MDNNQLGKPTVRTHAELELDGVESDGRNRALAVSLGVSTGLVAITGFAELVSNDDSGAEPKPVDIIAGWAPIKTPNKGCVDGVNGDWYAKVSVKAGEQRDDRRIDHRSGTESVVPAIGRLSVEDGEFAVVYTAVFPREVQTATINGKVSYPGSPNEALGPKENITEDFTNPGGCYAEPTDPTAPTETTNPPSETTLPTPTTSPETTPPETTPETTPESSVPVTVDTTTTTTTQPEQTTTTTIDVPVESYPNTQGVDSPLVLLPLAAAALARRFRKSLKN